MKDIDEYQYYATVEGSDSTIGPYRRPAAIKSAMQTSWRSYERKGKKFIIKRAKVVFDEDWQEEWSF